MTERDQILELREKYVEEMHSERIATVKVTNTSDHDVVHTFDGKPFGIKKCESAVMPKFLAALLLKHKGDEIEVEGYEERVKKESFEELPKDAIKIESNDEFKKYEKAKKLELDAKDKEIAELKKKLEVKEVKKVSRKK